MATASSSSPSSSPTPSTATPTWASFDANPVSVTPSSSSNANLTSPSLPPSSSSSSSPQQTASVLDGARTIYAQDLLHVHQVPCARDAFLFGLAAGFGIGGLHFVVRGTTSSTRSSAASAWRSMNYFVGAWALGSAGAFQFCQRQREMERRGINRAVEIMERKRKEKEEEMKKARELVRIRREQARAEEERRRRWWRLGRWLSGNKEKDGGRGGKVEETVADELRSKDRGADDKDGNALHGERGRGLVSAQSGTTLTGSE